ncbi:MAG: MMPL family transporter [Gemmataceae bacterium]
MFTFVGRFVAAHPWLVCAAWLTLGIALHFTAPRWDSRAQDDDIHFLPARCASVKGYLLLQEAFPQEVFASRLIVVVERRDRRLGGHDLALVDQLVTDLTHLREREPALQIRKIYSHRDAFIGKRLLSDDGHCTLVQVALDTPYLALHTREVVDRADEVIRARLAEAVDAPDVQLSGPAGIGRDLVAASGRGLDRTTLATVVLVVVILLCVYRSPLLALVPLLTIALAVWVALSVLALLTLIPGFVLVNVSQVFAVVMLYGAGTDYCLFLVSRYREELAPGGSPAEALRRAVGGVGGAVAASAGTVICGMALMGTAEFVKVRCGGPAIAVSLAVALAASLTLTPALLRLFGRSAFWPVGVPQAPTDHGVWEWVSRRVAARPVLAGLAAGLLLLPLAVLGMSVRPTYRATAELSPNSSSVLGLQAIQRHFTAGELGPITVLLESSTDWSGSAGRQAVERLYREFLALPHVAEVRCLTHPLGKPVDEPPPPPPARKNLRGSIFTTVWKMAAENVSEQIHKQARAFYVADLDDGRQVTRLDVVLDADPFDPRAAQTLDRLQGWLVENLPEVAPGARAECYGITVSAQDMARVTESDRQRINLLVLSGIFLILLLLVRGPVFAAYLLATVLLSYYATLGATTLFATWWHLRPLGEIDWRVPFFLFTILVAVGEDYNIFLVSRALEERKRHGGPEGMRRALAQTGGTITSCGLIMAGTFATLLMAGLNTLVQVGFALAFGVLLDTFLVRPVLVPAFAMWWWRREGEPRSEAWR